MQQHSAAAAELPLKTALGHSYANCLEVSQVSVAGHTPVKASSNCCLSSGCPESRYTKNRPAKPNKGPEYRNPEPGCKTLVLLTDG